jgi:hypothetical protein
MTRHTSQRSGAACVTLILTAVCVTLIALVSPASAHGGGGTIHVQPGQHIQAAVEAAHSGDRIIVGAGTYAEQLTITKDGIALVGHGAILVPPPADESKQNTCSGLAGNGTQAGICVQGSEVKLADFVVEHRKVLSVGRKVKGVSITGFQVRGFSGENIAVVGAQDARVSKNNLTDGQRYGVLTVGSKNTRIAHNTVVSTKPPLLFIGICMDDVAGPQVSSNHISGYNIALCVQTPGADVHDNEVSNCCVGAFVDPGINGAKMRRNHISAANPSCPTNSNVFGVFGIIIAGAVNTKVQHNLIEGQREIGRPDRIAAGIAVVDFTQATSIAIASGNMVMQNTLRNNDVDLLVFTNGTGNVIAQNKCTTSIPDGLCALK